MSYPPFLLRHINFRQQELVGQPISTAALDAEANDRTETINEINRRLRLIQDAGGRLINIAAQISQALVGTDRLVADGVATVFVTTITWDAAFSAGNVLVVANGETVDPNDVAVADDGNGFLEVTLGAAPAAGWVLVAAYSQGAGIAARLFDTSDPANGANMVGVEDVDNHFVSATVEGALAELATAIDDLTTALGTIGDIWTKNGTSIAGDPAAADWDLGGNRLTDIADAIDPQDAVSLSQLQSFVQNLDALLTIFIRADGAVPFTADQSMDGNKLTDVGAPTAAGDATNKGFVDAAVATAIMTSLSVAGLKTSTLRGTLTGPVTLGQAATDIADADQVSSPATVVNPTLTGVPKPGAADQVANKLYVDAQILQALGGGLPYISPYAEHIFGNSLTGIEDDGAVTNVTAGGVVEATTVVITVPQTPGADLFIFASGDVTISDDLTLDDELHTLEIQSAGSITIDAALIARDIRLRAAGTITIMAGASLTANTKDGVVAVNSAQDFVIAGDLVAPLIFCYAEAASILSGTLTAKVSNSPGGYNSTWATDLVPGSTVTAAIGSGSPHQSPYWQGNGGEWGRTCGRRLPPRPTAFDLTTVVDSQFPVWDYLSPYAGVGGDSSRDVASQGAGGGSGPAGAGTGGQASSAGAQPQPPKLPGAARATHLPAAPGGGGGLGYSTTDPALGGEAGGVIVVRVRADLTCTGATLDAAGGDGEDTSREGGGGGGGTVKTSSRGTLTGGTFNAAGGQALGSPGKPGGGGKVLLAALGYAGGQTVGVAAGTPNGSGLGGATNGASSVLSLTGAEWDILYSDAILDR